MGDEKIKRFGNLETNGKVKTDLADPRNLNSVLKARKPRRSLMLKSLKGSDFGKTSSLEDWQGLNVLFEDLIRKE